MAGEPDAGGSPGDAPAGDRTFPRGGRGDSAQMRTDRHLERLRGQQGYGRVVVPCCSGREEEEEEWGRQQGFRGRWSWK